MAKDAQANEPNAEVIREAFEEILSHEKRLEQAQSEYMKTCRAIRGDMKTVYDEAKEAGVTKKVLKAKVKQHNYLKKADKCRTDLEADEQNEFDLIVQKLGDLADLPLGLAALNGAGKDDGQHLHS
ncbi:hypothetical protein [Bradyrhizobium paxllaeri]|uniref:hypothetical protein n=1 Tax=Bradyrhizobium paxllaeri TaxID=190148 RepID=UPI00114725AF|nr:hypothetical protein [Bradyrhizobium paxllaeri]